MNSYQAIVEWAATDLPEWEADLVRRLLQDPALGLDQLKQIAKNALCAFGINEQSDNKECSPPVYELDGLDVETTDDPIKLCSIDLVENINAIHSEAKLPFGHSGITLIYGENGSGKSGYSRILKNACFAKHVEPTLLSNIYKPKTSKQSARISFLKNGNREEWTWSPGKNHAGLASINVFDTDCGKTLLDSNNRVTYKPRGADIFDHVSQVIESVKNTIQLKLRDAKKPTINGLEDNTEVQAWLNRLSDKTNSADVKTSLTWSEQDTVDLANLTSNIADYENGTTVKTIAKLTKISAERLPRAIQKLTADAKILTATKPEEITSLQISEVAAKKAYDLSLSTLDKTDPLEGVHSDPWKILFKAAREFSTSHAYISSEFPNTSEDALCVLCMQPLDDHAKERLERFERFMQDKSKVTYDQAVTTLNNKKNEIINLVSPEAEAYEPLCNELVEILGSDFGLAEAFRTLKTRQDFFKSDLAINAPYNRSDVSAESIKNSITEKLQNKLKELQESIAPEKYELDKESFKKKTNKKLLSNASDKITNYIDNLKHNKNVESATTSLRQTKTRFSGKAKSIIAQLVTPDFITNFKAELETFGIELQVDIAPIVKDSDTSHSFSIGAQKPGKVLSEGEQKVVSLAAYLAEIKTFANSSPIVFDDPVSSLDHVYREKIASRLCQEALSRQLIIFTHDLALIMEIDGKCTEMALSQSTRPAVSSFTVRRNGKDSGFCHTEAPWRGMSTSSRAHNLEQELNSFKDLYDTDISNYNKRSAMLYCLLREAWEASIEQDLFFDIVSRGRNSVQTTRLGQITIEPSDASRVTTNMSLSSSWMYGHDKSRALSENRPAPAEIKIHINELRTFASDIATRRKAAEKAFKAQTQAPISTFG
ncbi:AAA family ATPase [Pseudomonas umsongensis]|uniref:AAA family ATPase n=1 Tax=Pseudomonas umsongensis TaxID=198618 RepID=UPI00200A9432|nr:AAA family ATPase [Pseudomonas umsongensis]MCK8686145.1 AAA family ATPase [Pseudomonas umsongensis]